MHIKYIDKCVDNKEAKSMNTIYDSKLRKIYLEDIKYDHFKNHNSYMPFVGDTYGESELGKKILLVGESHYISNKTEINKVTEKRWLRLATELGTQGDYIKTNLEFSKIWYSDQWESSRIKNIIEEVDGSNYYHTRNIVDLFVNKKNQGRAITMMFGYPLKSLDKDFLSKKIYMREVDERKFNDFAFMNFFQRPALDTGERIKNVILDDSISTKILNQVIEVLEVDQVFILSILAYKTYINHKECKHKDIVQGLYHPCSRLWKKSKSGETLHNYFFNL